MKTPQIMLWGYFLFMAVPILKVTADHTLRVMCDDVTTIYFDGKEQSNVPGTNHWNTLATSTIPANVKEVMIGCRNVGGNNGIKAEITDSSGKLVSQTGKSWKCSNNKDSGYMPAFVEVKNLAWRDKLGNAAIIWSGSGKDATAYCKFEMADSASCPSSQDHTLKLMCDDWSTIYYDGVQQKNVAGDRTWNALVTSTIPASTKQVLVKCENPFGANGIKAQIVNSSGKVVSQTGKSWQCSTEANFGFKPAFVEANRHDWNDNLGTAETIWSGTGHDRTAYCKFTLSGCSRAPPPAPPAADHTLKVMCDDVSTIYFDGVAQKNVPGTGSWNTLATLKIPAKTVTVMVGCKNLVGANGIKAQIFDHNGKLFKQTGPSWRCSKNAKSGFKRATISNSNSNAWKNVLGSTPIIWSSSSSDETAYCKTRMRTPSSPSSGSGCRSNSYSMQMMCDDRSTIYYDGVEQKNVKGTQDWNTLATSSFPASTKEVMVKCQNLGGGYGIKAQIFNNRGRPIRQTNKYWKCSNKPDSGFKRATVTTSNASTWKDKLGNAQIIWSSGPIVGTAYCKTSLPGCAEEM